MIHFNVGDQVVCIDAKVGFSPNNAASVISLM
jgi:hypothetical protein